MKVLGINGSARKDGNTAIIMNKKMVIVGSTYWNMVYGQMPGDVLKDEEGLQNMQNLGENMAYVLHKLNDNKSN